MKNARKMSQKLFFFYSQRTQSKQLKTMKDNFLFRTMSQNDPKIRLILAFWLFLSVQN